MTPTPRQVGFRDGLAWLPAAATLLAGRLGPVAGIAALWLLVSMAALAIPLAGQVALVLFTPMLTAGVLLAFDRMRQGLSTPPTILFAGWKDPARRTGLLLVGAWSLVGSLLAAMILAGWLGSQLSPEQLEAAMADPEQLAELLRAVDIGGGLVLAMTVMSLVLATMYFGIPLIMFAGRPAVPSLLDSLRAVLMNWAAFAGFVLSVAGLALGIGVILMLVLAVFSLALGDVGIMLGQVVILLVTMLVQVLMAGAQYVAFQRVYGSASADGEGGSGDADGQLVA
ncbi:MAG: hypothetical protein GVY11_07645 [Gammaproteobacteria bacterium]|jgi:hypothetical protein|nr:hypothetical protein [Gammaproteobacteria bacterium]